MGDVYGYEGLPQGPSATADWYRFDGASYKKVSSANLLNPIAPVDIEVTNRGVLVTIDNWHNLGHGNVLVIYSPSGAVLRKFSLRDLYSKGDVERIQTSTSSVRWRCEGLSTSLESPTELWVDDSLGGRFVFKLDTATFTYQRGGGTCK